MSISIPRYTHNKDKYYGNITIISPFTRLLSESTDKTILGRISIIGKKSISLGICDYYYICNNVTELNSHTCSFLKNKNNLFGYAFSKFDNEPIYISTSPYIYEPISLKKIARFDKEIHLCSNSPIIITDSNNIKITLTDGEISLINTTIAKSIVINKGTKISITGPITIDYLESPILSTAFNGDIYINSIGTTKINLPNWRSLFPSTKRYTIIDSMPISIIEFSEDIIRYGTKTFLKKIPINSDHITIKVLNSKGSIMLINNYSISPQVVPSLYFAQKDYHIIIGSSWEDVPKFEEPIVIDSELPLNVKDETPNRISRNTMRFINSKVEFGLSGKYCIAPKNSTFCNFDDEIVSTDSSLDQKFVWNKYSKRKEINITLVSAPTLTSNQFENATLRLSSYSNEIIKAYMVWDNQLFPSSLILDSVDLFIITYDSEIISVPNLILKNDATIRTNNQKLNPLNLWCTMNKFMEINSILINSNSRFISLDCSPSNSDGCTIKKLSEIGIKPNFLVFNKQRIYLSTYGKLCLNVSN